MKTLIEIISGEIGVKEVDGKGDNPQILNYAKECGFTSYRSDDTAWCSLFVNWASYKAGLERSKDLSARSWLNVGSPTDRPEPGDVVVFWRENRNSWKGHVGFFMGFSYDKKRVYTFGGNQGDQVSLTAYPENRLLGFRRLSSKKHFEFSRKNLRTGDTGEEVVQLQIVLKQLGYDCGTSDGIFGTKTERCLKDFQTSTRQLRITGIFDKTTREYLVKILEQDG